MWSTVIFFLFNELMNDIIIKLCYWRSRQYYREIFQCKSFYWDISLPVVQKVNYLIRKYKLSWYMYRVWGLIRHLEKQVSSEKSFWKRGYGCQNIHLTRDIFTEFSRIYLMYKLSSTTVSDVIVVHGFARVPYKMWLLMRMHLKNMCSTNERRSTVTGLRCVITGA